MISCNQHDYIEIVCMYHYPIKLTLKSGEVIQGIAQDTRRNASKEECMEIKMENGERVIVLSELKKLEVCVENPHLQSVVFD